MEFIRTRSPKNRVLFILFVWISFTSANGQIDSLWKIVPIDFNGLSRVIEGDDFLRLSGEFNKANGLESIVLVVDSTEQIIGRINLISAWQINVSLIWNERRMYGGNGLWVEQTDSFVNVIGKKDDVFAICDLGDSIVLGGSFRNETDSIVACLLVCDSNFNCHSLPFVNNLFGDISRISLYDSFLVVAGNFNLPGGFKEIAQYRDGTWSPLGNGILGGGDEWIEDVVVFHDTLFVSGRFYENAGNPGSLIMRWDGKNWLQTGKQNTGVQAHDLFVYQDHLLASGIITSADGKAMDDLIRWNGTSWDGIPVAMQHGRIFRMGEFKGLLYLSGDFREHPDSSISHLIRIRDSFSYQTQLITSVQEFDAEKNVLVIYPNPSNGTFYISSKDLNFGIGGWQIEIFNSIGLSMSYEPQLLDESRLEINVQDYSPGVYWVRLCCGTNCGLKRVLLK